MGQASWRVGDATAVRSSGVSTMEIGAHKGTCRNDGLGLEGGKFFIARPQSCKQFSKILRQPPRVTRSMGKPLLVHALGEIMIG